MSVKTIFKVLIGTIVVIVITSIVLEVYNIKITAFQISQITKLACKQACELFAQESYKQYNSNGVMGGATKFYDVYDSGGNLYVSGNFYKYNSPEAVYNSLYRSSDFRNWLNSEVVRKGDWYNLKVLVKVLDSPDDLEIDEDSEDYEEILLGMLYKERMMTPMNLGIPYLDMETVERIFKWNVAQLFSNCNSDSILIDDLGNPYVSFNGFRVYADRARIINIEYRTYDLSDSSEKKEFIRLTNLDPDKLGIKYDGNLSDLIKSNEDERNRVCIAGIRYLVPVAYEGISPIKNIFNYVWNKEVEGINGNSGRSTTLQWNDVQGYLEGGGFGENIPDGVLPLSTKLLFYVVR